MSPETRRVGFIGIGTMGLPMASNLLAQGYQVLAFDLVPTALDAIASRGAERASSAAGVGAHSTTVISMLPSAAAVEAALAGPDGVMGAMAAGGLLIEMRTMDPGTTRRVAERADGRGLRLVGPP